MYAPAMAGRAACRSAARSSSNMVVLMPVTPDVVSAPLVGFDAEGYRLGYGGGFYDRTLAAMDPRPLVVGVGMEIAMMPTIRPQPFDIPMDVIVTGPEAVFRQEG